MSTRETGMATSATNINRKKIFANLFGCIIIGIIVIIGTFPNNDWSFSSGIDGSLIWVYNYLFENNPALGKHIIFPHGPLAFFMYPTPDNILITVLFISFLKLLLVFSITFLLIDEKNLKKWLITGLVAYVFSIIANGTTLILINILLLYCNYFISKKNAFKYIAFFLTALSLYIKAYVAIVSGLFFFSFICYWFYTLKSIRQFLMDCLTLLALMVVIWIGMYKTVDGFLEYIWGMIQLAQDNSSAASYYPYNNWWILSLFFLLLAIIFLINRTRKTVFYISIISLGLFATWKHGMAREDIFHVQGLFVYVIICLLVLLLFQKKKIYLSIALSIATLYIFSINKKNAIGYFPKQYDLCSASSFIDFVFNFTALKQQAELRSQENVVANKLPDNIRHAISNSTTDSYPWDYSIIAVNNLNWQPRVVIQSYAAYTSWLDAQNAKHFNSNLAPDFLIWENLSAGVNGGDMNSIDSRYLLNDEPQTIIQLLRNYDHYYSDKKFKIIKKRVNKRAFASSAIGRTQTTWGQWINVPDVKESILRAKLTFDKTFFQSLKSFLYKDEQFWIYLQLKNGIIHKYRIVPKNAVDGLWINPYIYNTTTAYAVEKIMFKCSMQKWLTDKLTIDWEEIKFTDSAHQVQDFFNISRMTVDSTILKSINSYEEKWVKSWNNLTDAQFSDNSFTGTKSHLVKAQSYSCTFALALDSVLFQNVKIITDCWIKLSNDKYSNSVSLIISIEDAKGSVIWKSIPTSEQLIDEDQWNNVYNSLEYVNNTPGRTLKVYVYNTSEEDLLIDDFRVMINKRAEIRGAHL